MTTRRAILAGIPGLASVAILAAGCFGNGGSLLNLASGLGAAPPAGGIRFDINGTIILVSGSSYVDFHQGSDPAANFTGTTGCASRHFLADYSDNISMLFSYSADQAQLLLGNEIYDFDGPPEVANGTLSWSGDFDAAGGNPAESIEVDVGCPAPATS